jgi:hypothetical protein
MIKLFEEKLQIDELEQDDFAFIFVVLFILVLPQNRTFSF